MECAADESPREKAARYLEHLRAERGEAGPGTSASAAPDHSLACQKERRRYARYTCAGSVEMRKEWSSVSTWGTFTDISLGGCYVELQATFPPETNMELNLELEGIRVHAKAVVRVTYPFLGMGLAFTVLSKEDDARLHEMISRLAGPPRPAVDAGRSQPSKPAVDANLPIITDPVAALDALTRYFETNAQLPRDVFLDLIRRSQAISPPG
jgi:PilZ domain-containing protein